MGIPPQDRDGNDFGNDLDRRLGALRDEAGESFDALGDEIRERTGLDAEPEDEIEDGLTEEQLDLADEEERLPWLESDDDYEDEAVDSSRLVIVGIIGLLAIISVIGLAYYFTRPAPDATLVADGSTIEAPEEPYRTAPADPGGEDVEGTGDLAFEVSEGGAGAAQADGGLAAAGTATPAPSATASAAASAAPVPSIDRAQGNGAAASTAAGGVGVQVGAYSTRASAENGWSELTRRHSALSGLSNRIVQAEVDGATVYRLQAVTGSAQAADQLCRTLRNAGADCAVRR